MVVVVACMHHVDEQQEYASFIHPISCHDMLQVGRPVGSKQLLFFVEELDHLVT